MDVSQYVENIRKLRDETGEGIMFVRKAIDAHPDDYEAAKEHLRCAGQAVVRRAGSRKPCGCLVKGG